MVRQQLITDSQKLRLQAVHCKQHNQSWSASKIGKHIGCSSKFVNRWVERHQQFGSINDKHRSGRPQKADDAAEQYICMAAKPAQSQHVNRSPGLPLISISQFAAWVQQATDDIASMSISW